MLGPSAADGASVPAQARPAATAKGTSGLATDTVPSPNGAWKNPAAPPPDPAAPAAPQPLRPPDELARIQEYESLRDRGLELFREGRCEDAIPVLVRAQRIYPNATRLLLPLGSCHRKLGQLDAAKQQLSLYLQLSSEEAVPAPERAQIQAAIDDLERRIEAARKPRIIELPPPRRPRWQLGLGGGMISLGGVLLGFGIPALALHGNCVQTPSLPAAACPQLYDTRGMGAGLAAAGGTLALAGLLTLIAPPRRPVAQTPRLTLPRRDPAVGLGFDLIPLKHE